MGNDLKARLCQPLDEPGMSIAQLISVSDQDRHEAFDRIEELERERDRLKADNEFLHTHRGQLVIERDEARARAERLAEALEYQLPDIENELQHWRMGTPINIQEIEARVSGLRAALNKEPSDG